MIAELSEAASLVATPEGLAFIVVGVALGILVGSLPGIGPPVGIALILPLTIALEPWSALSLMFALYVGAMYGGAISAIIVNVPGTPGAIASTFDGYPLAKQGKARPALEISVLASSFGTVLSAVLLILAAPVLVTVILLFGTPEYALIAIFGLTIIPLVSQGSMGKSLMVAAFGVLLSTIGMAPMTPTPRYTFGSVQLIDGLEFVAILLGVFAISEMIKLSAYEGSISETISDGDDRKADGGSSAVETGNEHDTEAAGTEPAEESGLLGRVWEIYVRNPVSFVRSMLIGLVIGFVPAAGGSVSNIVAYAAEKQAADDPETFGEGNVRGLIASESANSGTISGALVPLLAFGIPGSATTAIILGGMLMHGVRPGPGLFESEVHVSYATFLAVVLAGLVLLLVGLATVTRMSVFTKVDTDLIIPIVVILCVIGSYSLNLNYMDLLTVLGAGLVSYLLLKYDYSLVAFIMGVILGPIVESNVHRSFQLGDASIFVSSYIGIALVALIVVSLVGPPLKLLHRRYVAG